MDGSVSTANRRGRPRSFDEGEALKIALDVFWRQGYEATSLDDLTSAMNLSRSSFYACFRSKRALLLQSIRHYTDDNLARIREIRSGEKDMGRAAVRILDALADAEGGPHDCLVVNSITELAPHDPEVAELGRRYFEQVEAELQGAFDGVTGMDAAGAARMLVTLSIGAITLRKAGLPAEALAEVVSRSRRLVPTLA